jgi:signal transduction histidine kinase
VDEYTGTRGEVIVFSDITGRKILEKQIAEISEREQRRIGQDLHDGLCQHLVSTAFAATLLQRKLEEKKVSDAAAAEQIADMINDAISQARGMARGLHPVRLEEDGLAPALEQLAEMTQMLTGISCEFHIQGEVIINDPIAAANLYRIAQEAVNNALKHAKAQHISVDLEAVEEEITLTIRDDGVGISRESTGRGMGLYIMNHRARLIGASLDVRRGAAGGTIVNCSFLNTKSIQHPHV